MKRGVAFVLVLFVLFLLVACQRRGNEGNNGDEGDDILNPYFVGKVIEIYDGGCLLEVTDNGNFSFSIGYKVEVRTNIENCPEYSVGDCLSISFDGVVAESYPPQIHGVTIISKIGNNFNPSPTMLVELEKYSEMTMEETTSIEVVYEYTKGEYAFYEFVIEDQETIEEIMTEVFNTKLTDYPENQDIDFVLRRIVVHQSDVEYDINLCYNFDGNGKQYLYQTHGAFDIIEKYIENNLKK